MTGRVEVSTDTTGLSVLLDGRDIAAFSWVDGITGDDLTRAVMQFASAVSSLVEVSP